MKIDRRVFLQRSLAGVAALAGLFTVKAYAKTYLTVEQAKQILWGAEHLEPKDVSLTPEQMKAIRKASGTRVRASQLQVWVTASGGWFIVDQVIGKHENIDVAVALTSDGKVKGLEVLTYRESYGYEVMDKNWRAQFFGKESSTVLKLGRDIKNISGATLSCRHLTDGVNRLLHTWNLVLRFL